MEPSPFYPSDDPLSQRAHILARGNNREDVLRDAIGTVIEVAPCFFNDNEDQNMV